MRQVLVLALAVLGSRPGCLGAQAAVTGPASLVGIREFAVMVVTTPEAPACGLDSASLQILAELRLRQAGLRVVIPGSYAQAVLLMRFSARNPQPGVCLYLIEAQVSQEAMLRRDPKATVWAITWFAPAGFGTVPSGNPNAPQYLRTEASDILDNFLNSYFRMNPK